MHPIKIPVRIIYYEDNAGLRESMTLLISGHSDLELVGSFENCFKIKDQVSELQPDVILLDIDLPGISGIEAVRLAKAVLPEVEVIMLTVFDDEDKIIQSIKNGASGYLLKESSPREIIEAIFDICSGGSPLTPNVARKMLQQFFEKPVVDFSLSERELQIIKELVKGYSYKLVALNLNIKLDTVRSHIRNIYEKMNVNSKTEAVLKAIKHKIV